MADLASQLVGAVRDALGTADSLVVALAEAGKRPLAAPKASKASADYRPATEDDKSCASCEHFNARRYSCDSVSGRIEPDWVSNLWMARKGTKSVMAYPKKPDVG